MKKRDPVVFWLDMAIAALLFLATMMISNCVLRILMAIGRIK